MNSEARSDVFILIGILAGIAMVCLMLCYITDRIKTADEYQAAKNAEAASVKAKILEDEVWKAYFTEKKE